jgi:hypothetical protein
MIATPLLIKLAAFTVAMLPLLVENLRRGTASNRSNAILFVAGLAYAGYLLATGAVQPTLGLFGGWVIVIAIALALAAIGVAPGGVAKTFAALAPWLDPWHFIGIATAGLILSGIVGLLRKKPAGIALPVYLMTCAIWLLAR